MHRLESLLKGLFAGWFGAGIIANDAQLAIGKVQIHLQLSQLLAVRAGNIHVKQVAAAAERDVQVR